MKIDFEGRVWQLEMDEITMRQGEQIQAYTGLTPMAWYKSILDTDAAGWLKSMACLYGLIRQQNGAPEIALPQLDFAPLKLMAAFGTAAGQDEETSAAEVEADPTKPADANAAASQQAPAPPPEGSPAG